MDIGKMTDRISFYTTVSSEDSGGLTETRSLLFQCWAKIIPLNQARAFAYGITENFRSYEITVRFRESITTKQTITWDNKILTIASVINTDNAEKELKLICTEND
jgi:SPP1 family predicted phage head-tail adaptor